MVDYLRRCGYSSRKIAGFDLHTRLYHDLGLYGDDAEAVMEELVVRYHVDLAGFDFDRFFPPEYPGKNRLTVALLSLVPFAHHICTKREKYEPLTLERIERALRSGRWGD
ncbi:MAG TPA: hypothetical protein DEB06_00450 [Phycisphaerales bacterium]|nr:hypothetical protein [Phycisphaerales bacterium]